MTIESDDRRQPSSRGAARIDRESLKRSENSAQPQIAAVGSLPGWSGPSEACLRWRADADAGMGCRGSIVNAVPLRILQEKGGDREEAEVVTR